MATNTQTNYPYEQASPLYEDDSLQLLHRETNRIFLASRELNGKGYTGRFTLEDGSVIGSDQIAPARERWRIKDPSLDER